MLMHHDLEPAEDVMPGTDTTFVYCRRCGQPANQHVKENNDGNHSSSGERTGAAATA